MAVFSLIENQQGINIGSQKASSMTVALYVFNGTKDV